uniref:PORF2b n=1 Tax=Torque teno virus TaxID=68887 RepID=Q9JGT2_9VIRU|nr:pORF2b [Torque teno virus]
MHFSTCSIKKRTLSLLPLHPSHKTRPSVIGMWRPPLRNDFIIQHNWFYSCFHSHSSMCGCANLIGHFNHIAAMLGRPEDQKPPPPPGALRPLPALPAAAEAPGDRSPWPIAGGGDAAGGGGGGDGAAGDAAGGPADADLLDAVDAAEQ